MDQSAVLVEERGAVRLLTLNNPAQLNALNEDIKAGMMSALVARPLGRFRGRGGDHRRGPSLQRRRRPQALRGHGQVWRLARERFTDLDFPRAFTNFPKPLIEAINGTAVGWGASLCRSCATCVWLAARRCFPAASCA
ncbi:hypothetical protein DFAR_2750003 [Desulfarculales bacterium]